MSTIAKNNKQPVAEEPVEESIPGALRKPRRDKLIRKEVLAFNPPNLIDGEDGILPQLVYIDEKGNKHECETTKQLWVSVDGRPAPGRKLQGLEVRKDKSFYLYFERRKGKDVAVSFTEYPGHMYSKQTGFPEGSDAIDGIEFVVDPGTGSLKVDKIPQAANSAAVARTIKAVDAVTQLYIGQTLGPDMEVLSVSGNRVSVTPPVMSVENTGYRQLQDSDGFNFGTY